LRAEHRAEFVSYRARTIDTVLGMVTFRRARYDCVEALVTFYYQARTWAAAGRCRGTLVRATRAPGSACRPGRTVAHPDLT
jgi:inosine/xanthosine triphosphate pyrophosphatase family protein